MPGTTRQGNQLTDPGDGDWIANLFQSEDPSYNYGSLLPLREKKGDDPQNPTLELAWPGLLRELAQGTKNLIMGAAGEKEPLTDSSDAMALATGGRMNNTSEAPILTRALAGIGARGSPNDLGMFLGRRAKDFATTDKPKFAGVGGGQRFEISDLPSNFDKAGFKPASKFDTARAYMTGKDLKKAQMSDVFTHPELYANYPGLAKTPVYMSTEDKPWHGNYYPNTRTLHLNSRTPIYGDVNGQKMITGYRDATPTELQSTAVHELQHRVQAIEGWAQGGSPTGVIGLLGDARQQAMVRGMEAKSAGDQAAAELHYAEAYRLQRAIMDHIGHPYDAYNRLAGEVEARNVQTRLQLQQMAVQQGYKPELPGHPTDTQSVPSGAQYIVREPGMGPQDSVPRPPGWGTTTEPPKTLSAGEIKGQEAVSRYGAVPDSLMGFADPNKSRLWSGGKPYEDQKYPHEQAVSITWPDGTRHFDYVKGMNETHALARAARNWPGARIEAVNPVEHDPFSPPSPQNPHPVDYDPFTSKTVPGVEQRPPDIAPRPVNENLNDRPKFEALYEKFLDNLALKNAPGLKTPPEVVDAVKKLGTLGFDRVGEALGEIRSSKNWAQSYDVDPQRSLEEYGAHRTIQNWINQTGGHGVRPLEGESAGHVLFRNQQRQQGLNDKFTRHFGAGPLAQFKDASEAVGHFGQNSHLETLERVKGIVHDPQILQSYGIDPTSEQGLKLTAAIKSLRDAVVAKARPK